MTLSSQNPNSGANDPTVSGQSLGQMEEELSSLSFLLSELRTQEASHLNRTSTEDEHDPTPGDELQSDVPDAEVQALLEQLEKLHGFADNVEDRMDTLLAKLDDMLGALDVPEGTDDTVAQPNDQPENGKESDTTGNVNLEPQNRPVS